VARPREFNEQDALNQALQVFWDKGYEATSLHDLTGVMEISKSSFYDTFSSKHDLFLTCLDLYTQTQRKWVLSVLESDRPVRESIAAVLQFVIDEVIDDGNLRGCFLGNCAVEVGQRDQAVAKRVSEGFDYFNGTFEHTLQRGIDEGQLTTIKDVSAAASYLVSSLNGLRIMAIANPDRKRLEGVMKMVMSNIC
jgi:TetR/AcrR family transcriptional regulator, transcriptional repressor for nem operon